MGFSKLFDEYKRRLTACRPFLRTKIGSRLALLGIADFIFLFFAPLIRGFVGAALFGCVASVYLILIWRKHDRESAVVPAAILCVPMLLDMLLYLDLAVVVGFIVAMLAMFFAALSPALKSYDAITDTLYTYLIAGAICVGVVVAACILLFIVQISWWILCVIAFLIVAGIFFGVVFSTAAYTASDGRRQAAKKHSQSRRSGSREQERHYREYRPRQRDNQIYNLDDDDIYEE